MSDEEPTQEQADVLQAFCDKVSEHIARLNKERKGKIVEPEEVAAQAAFWLKIVEDSFPDLTPIIATFVSRLQFTKTTVPRPASKYVN
jgi:hypothetical protein